MSGRESENGITVLPPWHTTAMRSGSGTESMQREATSVTGREAAGRRKTDTEKEDIGTKKRVGTSHLGAAAGDVMIARKEMAIEDTNTKSLKEVKKERKPVMTMLLSRTIQKLQASTNCSWAPYLGILLKCVFWKNQFVSSS